MSYEDISCRHYNGLFDASNPWDEGSMHTGRKRRAGVEYRTFGLKPMSNDWPCTNPKMANGCPAHESYTQEEIDQRNKEIADILNSITAFDRRETENCPHCGQHVTSLRQVGRCVYASPCNCRVWQGKVPEAWR